MRELPHTPRAPTGASRIKAGRAGAGRTAAVAVLLAVTAAGLRSRGAFSRVPDQALRGASGSVLATALIAAEGIALIAFILLLAMARPRRKPHDEDEPPRLPFPWWAKTLGVLAAVAVLVTPFAVLLAGHTSHQAAPPAPGSARVRPPARGLTTPVHENPWPLIAGMAIAVAVVVAMALLSRRRKTRPAGPQDQARRLALAESLAAARAALEGTRAGARQAIIACYAAMERGFAAAGSAPAAADTPAEVLARATASGLIRSGSAASLTGLFRRARYSDEPMTGADAQAAAAALDSMQASLRAETERAEAGRAGTGPAGAPP